MNSIPIHMQEETTSSAGQTMKCMVCDSPMKSITNSHLKKHGMSCEEYKTMFPNAILGDFSRFDSWRNSDENRKHLRSNNEKVYSNLDIVKKMNDNKKAATNSEQYRRNLSLAMKKYSQTEEGRKRLSEKPVTARMKLSNFQRWVENFGIEEAVKKQLDWQSKNVLPSKSRDTKCELIVANLLSTVGIAFVKQLHVPRYYCDFYLPRHNLIIEVNGDYWHANPSKFSENDVIGGKKLLAREIWANDSKKVESLKSMGYNVLVLWESNLKNMTAQKLSEDIVRHCEKSQ